MPEQVAVREEWKPISGFEGRYEISNQGRVRTLSTYRPAYTGKVLVPWTQNRGYQYVALRTGKNRHTFAVHRLVLEAFVGPCPAGKQVAHWNGDPTDNRVENLRWASAAENIADRARHGRTAAGEDNASAKLDRKAAKTIKRLKDTGISAADIGHLACVSRDTVLDIWEGRTWKHL